MLDSARRDWYVLGMAGDRREKETLIPAFDPEALARELEEISARPTLTPAFEPSAYARMLDENANWSEAVRDTPMTLAAATPLPPLPSFPGESESTAHDATATLGRAMYGSYLSSDYPEALVLAERVLEREPDHALAQLVADGSRERMGTPCEPRRLLNSSVVRLKRAPFELVELVEIGGLEAAAVLGHVDGVADVAMVADLAGVPRPEAIDRLYALLEMGLLEVVNE